MSPMEMPVRTQPRLVEQKPSPEQRVREEIREMLRTSYDAILRRESSKNDPFFSEFQEKDVDSEDGFFEENKLDDQGSYTSEYRMKARLYFDEFLAFVQERRRAGDPPQQLEAFAFAWSDKTVTSSPNLFDPLSFSEQFVASARLNGYPETRHSFGKKNSGRIDL